MSHTRLSLIVLLALAAGLLLSCKKEDKNPGGSLPPPNAPDGLFVSSTSNTTVTLNWQDNSVDEQGFHIYLTQDTTVASTLIDSVVANVRQIMVDSLLPGTPYYFTVRAFNANGESDPSNRVRAVTSGTMFPSAPTQVTATAFEGDSIRVAWHSAGAQDSFLVQRRDSATTNWNSIASLPGNALQFTDHTVIASTAYYYRVGAKNAYSTAWSDSVYVVALAPGAPPGPVDLQVQVTIGTGVALTWTNLSQNVTGIVISRTPAGFPAQNIDTVGPDVSSFFDSLGTQFGLFYYQLRAFNENGASPWSQPVLADYRLHSPGVIPLAANNYWVYAVTDTTGSPTEERRISRVTFFEGKDYYLMTANASGIVDSMFYLRNDSTAPGCMLLHWPILPADHPQLLFKYPATQIRDSVFVDNTKIEVVIALPGQDMNVEGTVYHGVIAYEWFLSPSFRIIYYVKPGDVGIVREEHWGGPISHPVIVKTLNLRTYHVE